MFERLAAAGGAVRLQTQYRCHPAIAGAASSLFYGGAVSSGIPAAARPPLCAGEPGQVRDGTPRVPRERHAQARRVAERQRFGGDVRPVRVAERK